MSQGIVNLTRIRWVVRGALGLILVGSLVIRVWDLDRNPPGVYADEASLGWNAYCLLKTGRNEHGRFLPLSFPSIEYVDAATWEVTGFHDYKGPVYTYLTVPCVALLGLKPLAVRLPAALFGTLLVFVAFLLARRWFGIVGGLAAAMLVAVSPWAVHFSRVGFNATAAIPLTAVGLELFFRGLRRPKMLLPSGVVLAVAGHEYQPAMVFSVLLMAAMALVYWRRLADRGRWAIVWGLPMAALLIQPLLQLRGGAGRGSEGAARFAAVGLTNPVARRQLGVAEGHRIGRPEFAESWVFRHWWSASAFAYLRHWYPSFLVVHGDYEPRHSVTGYRFQGDNRPGLLAGVGELLWAEAALALLGAAWAIRHIRRPHARFLLAWLVLWPVPASLTGLGIPHAIRTLVSLPVWQVLGGGGAAWLRNAGRHGRQWATALVVGMGAVWAGQAYIFLTVLYEEYPNQPQVRLVWEGHMRDVVQFGMSQAGRFQRCIVSRSPTSQTFNSYIAYYTRPDPAAFIRGDRPFMWTDRIERFDEDTLYVLRVADKDNPAVQRFWAEAAGVSLDKVAANRDTLLRATAAASMQAGLKCFPEQFPSVFFVTPQELRRAALMVFSG